MKPLIDEHGARSVIGESRCGLISINHVLQYIHFSSRASDTGVEPAVPF
jgi:hypothetical protein